MKLTTCIFTVALLGAVSSFGEELILELPAAKDSFFRSNNRNRNNGASSILIMARNASAISLIGFDLSSVTNEILSAELSFKVAETVSTPISFTVSPMVHNAENAGWVEGVGNLGVIGQNALPRESSYQWRAFRDEAWTNADGQPVINLMDSRLWEPAIAKLESEPWTAGEWISLPIEDGTFLETIRTSEFSTVTFGMQGSSGDGFYSIHSRESGAAPLLKLTVKSDE
jgi:hypothetical protein